MDRARWTFSLLFLLLAATSAQAQNKGAALVFRLETPWAGRGIRLARAWLEFRPTTQVPQAKALVGPNGDGSVGLIRGVRYTVSVRRLRVLVGGSPFTIDPKMLTLSPGHVTVPSVGPIPQPAFGVSLPDGERHLRIRVLTEAGAPIAGTRVFVVWDGGKPSFPYGVFETDVAGQVNITKLLPGRTIVRILDAGPFAVAASREDRRGRSPNYSRELVIGPTHPDECTFRLRGAGVIHAIVDTRGLPQAPPLSLFTMTGKLAAGPRARPDADGDGAVFRFLSVPPGRYRVVATLPRGDAMFTEAVVRSGFVTPVRLSRARAGRRDYRLFLMWEKMPADQRRARFFLTRYGDAGSPTSVFEARRGRALEHFSGPALKDARYLLRYPKLRLARAVTLDARNNFAIDFTPPRPGFLTRGHRKVTLHLRHAGKPVSNYFVGLVSERNVNRQIEEWMRYTATDNGVAVFENVPAGWYRLRLFDNVLGVRHNLHTRQRPAVSVWREDVEIELDLSAR